MQQEEASMVRLDLKGPLLLQSVASPVIGIIICLVAGVIIIIIITIIITIINIIDVSIVEIFAISDLMMTISNNAFVTNYFTIPIVLTSKISVLV